MAENRKPTHDLNSVGAWAGTSRFTVRRNACELGVGSTAMAAVIHAKQHDHSDKSITSLNDHRGWQDVYRVPSDADAPYISFPADVVAEFLSSPFEKKGDG